MHGLADQIVHRSGAVQNRAAAEHGAALDDRAFVDSAITADQYVVFYDDRQSADRFEHSADLRSRRDVAVAPDLRATADEGVRIDHRAIGYVASYIDIHRRHAGDATAKVTAIADTRSARYHANAVRRADALQRIS